MHLKTLTLKGVKSFADAATLDFEPGVSVIVPSRVNLLAFPSRLIRHWRRRSESRLIVQILRSW